MKVNKFITKALVAASLLGGVEGLNAGSVNPERTETRDEGANISAVEVKRRLDEYRHKNSGKIEISNNENAPENILTRVMASEEYRVGGYLHVDVLIAFTILNRLPNWQNAMRKGNFSQELIDVVTNGRGWGLQKYERAYSSNVEPVPLKPSSQDIRPDLRVIARMILEGEFDDFNREKPTHFFHPDAQRAMHQKDPQTYKTVEEVEEKWGAAGLRKLFEDPHIIFFGR